MRAVCCVATTPHYQKGIARLRASKFITNCEAYMMNRHPQGSPSHSEVPYGFKAFSLKAAADNGADLLLWCDSSILPIRSLEPIWERIEKEGYWISRNGWNNYQWTADSAYWDLFPEFQRANHFKKSDADAQNKTIPHVVATTFGLNVQHEMGQAFLDEYYRLASETKAFCGPWRNVNNGLDPTKADGITLAPCGPPDVLGHRHDQTAASVIAWRLGMKLTDPPNIFAYSKRREDGTLHLSDQDQSTILLADGSMNDGVVYD